MVTAITEGIKISVETVFQAQHSDVPNRHFVFSYRILIENKSNSAIQLLRRHWFIFDSEGIEREVEGDGVVGEQPFILPNSSYSYVSGCHLNTDVGSMQGWYIMHRLLDGQEIQVDIPKFQLVVPYRLN